MPHNRNQLRALCMNQRGEIVQNSKQPKRRRKSRGNPEKRKPETQSGETDIGNKLKDSVSDEHKSQEKA